MQSGVEISQNLFQSKGFDTFAYLIILDQIVDVGFLHKEPDPRDVAQVALMLQAQKCFAHGRIADPQLCGKLPGAEIGFTVER